MTLELIFFEARLRLAEPADLFELAEDALLFVHAAQAALGVVGALNHLDRDVFADVVFLAWINALRAGR